MGGCSASRHKPTATTVLSTATTTAIHSPTAVSLPVSSAQDVNQRRLSLARELVNSGRPLSVSITMQDDDDDKDERSSSTRLSPPQLKKVSTNLDGSMLSSGRRRASTSTGAPSSMQEQLERDENWTGQLSLMRKFYDWEDIPMDFFVDQQVKAGGMLMGSTVVKPSKRMSLQISVLSDEEANARPPAPGEVIVNNSNRRDRGMSEML